MNLSSNKTPPSVVFMGDTEHADFRAAADLLRMDADLACCDTSPELIVVAHSRPGSVGHEHLHMLRRTAPLAGVLVLAGSWCEGELRTGRPWPGVLRLYWHEFPAWWRRQLLLRAAGHCPDWLRPDEHRVGRSLALATSARGPLGFVLLKTHSAATNDAFADVLHRAGYASVRVAGPIARSVRGANTAIWDGGQLSEPEEQELARLCAELAPYRTPVVALLDFPRRDRVDRALELGASAVLGKPWVNVDLLATIDAVVGRPRLPKAA